VELHRVSAENYAGDPGAAVAAALKIVPARLPARERRTRYWTDTARAYANWGRRDDCVSALLAAEREAPGGDPCPPSGPRSRVGFAGHRANSSAASPASSATTEGVSCCCATGSGRPEQFGVVGRPLSSRVCLRQHPPLLGAVAGLRLSKPRPTRRTRLEPGRSTPFSPQIPHKSGIRAATPTAPPRQAAGPPNEKHRPGQVRPPRRARCAATRRLSIFADYLEADTQGGTNALQLRGIPVPRWRSLGAARPH
jgi:hypothetical protein